MKPILLNLVLLIALAGASTGASELVLDVDGNPVSTASFYFILPAVSGGDGGGISLQPPNASTVSCPLYVSQTEDEANIGRPVGFRPVNSKEETVAVSSDVNLEFDAARTVCRDSTVWQMGPAGQGTWRYVTGGGVKGNPGSQTARDWFKIDKDGDHYKLTYCPAVCSGQCHVDCGELTVFRGKDGNRLLGIAPSGLQPNPLLVKFEKSPYSL